VLAAFQQHVLQRAVYGMHHIRPPWYYLEVLPGALSPWTALVPGALWLAFRRRDTHDRFLLVWALFVVAFFSVFTEKRNLYILPAIPAFALLVTRLFDAVREVAPRWLNVPLALSGILGAVVGLALPFVGRKLDYVPWWITVAMGSMLLCTGLAAAWAALRGRAVGSVLALGCGAGALYLALASWLYPALDGVKSARSFALKIRDLTAASRQAGHEVLAYRLSNLPEAFAFYSDGVYFRETGEPSVLAAHLGRAETVWAVANADDLDMLPPEAQARVVVLETTRLSRRNVALIRNATGTVAP
jgi:4-amino-4-deoxy-L-arabinose transferase-like glycosyltransferase